MITRRLHSLGNHLPRWAYRSRCVTCGAFRAPEGKFCGSCGNSLRRNPLPLAALLLLGGISLMIPFQEPSPPSPVHSEKRVNPHVLGMVPQPPARKRAVPTNRDDPEAVLERIDALLRKTRGGGREMSEAIALLDSLLKRFPDYPYALRLKANLQRTAQDLAGAAETYRQYLAANPGDMNVRFSLAQTLFQLDEPERSLEELDKVAAAFPRFKAVHKLRALVYRAQGREADAREARTLTAALETGGNLSKPPLIWHPRIPLSKPAPPETAAKKTTIPPMPPSVSRAESAENPTKL